MVLFNHDQTVMSMEKYSSLFACGNHFVEGISRETQYTWHPWEQPPHLAYKQPPYQTTYKEKNPSNNGIEHNFSQIAFISSVHSLLLHG